MQAPRLLRTALALVVLTASGGGLADGSANGDEFRSTANTYEEQAQAAMRNGRTDVGALYLEQASIKHRAASLADEGRWSEIDWNRYHDNERLISQLLDHAGTKHD